MGFSNYAIKSFKDYYVIHNGFVEIGSTGSDITLRIERVRVQTLLCIRPGFGNQRD